MKMHLLNGNRPERNLFIRKFLLSFFHSFFLKYEKDTVLNGISIVSEVIIEIHFIYLLINYFIHSFK